MGTPPCHRSRNPAYTTLNVPDRSTRAAIKICEHCPTRQQCAASALTAGTTIDGVPHPANDLVQAGVACRGDLTTAWQLAEIAGVSVPAYWDEKPARRKIDDHCKSCERPMVSWTRDAVPEGYVMHRGRGFCTRCRKQYQAALDEAPTVAQRSGRNSGRGLRKSIDRKRHSPHHHAAGPKREATVQLSLFSRAAALSADEQSTA